MRFKLLVRQEDLVAKKALIVSQAASLPICVLLFLVDRWWWELCAIKVCKLCCPFSWRAPSLGEEEPSCHHRVRSQERLPQGRANTKKRQRRGIKQPLFVELFGPGQGAHSSDVLSHLSCPWVNFTLSEGAALIQSHRGDSVSCLPSPALPLHFAKQCGKEVCVSRGIPGNLLKPPHSPHEEFGLERSNPPKGEDLQRLHALILFLLGLWLRGGVS